MILAAGRGIRLAPLTNALPKTLIHCAGSTLLGRLIRDFQNSGITDISIGVGWNGSLVQEYVQTTFSDSDITIIDVPTYEVGPLETLVTTIGISDETAIICPGDFVAGAGFLKDMINEHQSASGRILTLAMDASKNDGTRLFVDDNGTLRGINDDSVESTGTGRSAMLLIAEPSFLEECRTGRVQGKTRVIEILSTQLTNSKPIHTWHVSTDWFDVDSISELLLANRHLLTKEIPTSLGIYVPDGDTFETGDKLTLDSGIEINSGVSICGPVTIASGCILGPDSEIGPFVSMGEGTVLKRGCFISDAVVFGKTELSSNTRLSRVVVFNNRVFTE